MPSLHRIAVLTAGGCVIALLGSASHGQHTAAEQAAYMSGLRMERSMLAGPLATSPRSAMYTGEPAERLREPREVNLIGRGVVLEMGRVGPDGQFVRPRLLIGRQSPELRSWMMSMGLPPERCMLPTFRGRLQRDPQTAKLGAAVLMSARCTFY